MNPTTSKRSGRQPNQFHTAYDLVFLTDNSHAGPVMQDNLRLPVKSVQLQRLFACGFGFLPARPSCRRNFCPRRCTHCASGFLDRLRG